MSKKKLKRKRKRKGGPSKKTWEIIIGVVRSYNEARQT